MVNVKVWMASPFHYIPLFFFWVAKLCLYKVLDCIKLEQVTLKTCSENGCRRNIYRILFLLAVCSTCLSLHLLKKILNASKMIGNVIFNT